MLMAKSRVWSVIPVVFNQPVLGRNHLGAKSGRGGLKCHMEWATAGARKMNIKCDIHLAKGYLLCQEKRNHVNWLGGDGNNDFCVFPRCVLCLTGSVAPATAVSVPAPQTCKPAPNLPAVHILVQQLGTTAAQTLATEVWRVQSHKQCQDEEERGSCQQELVWDAESCVIVWGLLLQEDAANQLAACCGSDQTQRCGFSPENKVGCNEEVIKCQELKIGERMQKAEGWVKEQGFAECHWGSDGWELSCRGAVLLLHLSMD